MRRRRLAMVLAVAAAVAVGTAACSADRVDLAAAERRVFSQFGEDGVIEKLFEVIEPTQRYVVEFGAYDGVTNSNARNLVLNHGWRAFLIEGDPELAAKAKAAYADRAGVTVQEAWVYPGNVELLFEEAGVPHDLDLLVIDIDSNDYYVWRVIHDFRPKVVLIEANAAFPPPERMVIEFHPMNYWDQTPYHGASLQSLYELGEKKGYELVHVMRRGPNAFFVDRRYFDRFGIDDNTPVALAPKRGPHWKHPVLIPPGKESLHWRNLEIPKKFRYDR